MSHRRTAPAARLEAAGTGTATAVGGYANSGVHVGDVSVVSGAPVRTAYLEQVRRIAPVELRGRERELAELAEFCTSPGTAGAYRWWRAAAWTGKSALLSSFVLAPPPGVRIVSFFVTARMSSQNDRAAFIDNVLEQLLALLDQDPPRLLTESNREAHLLALLTRAAEACRERGEHFVLVVDGLDEDRGVTTDPDGHSIAALLPARPSAGMRVVVAGRPNPPVPDDVPADHPLRDPGVVRVLAPSPHAIAIRKEMERDLKRLLVGTVAEQDLLGLLTAAGGGLTAADLAELTGWSRYQVDDHLRTVAGRSFASRSSHYRPDSSPQVYLLGHEELQVTARDVLGPTRLAGYRDRLHTWAAEYRRQGWPASTPEYLLRGYHNMLREVRDLPRLVELGTDAGRQDRMLDLSGGDSAALAEIVATQELLLAEAEPDLSALVRLAIHRDHLRDRNRNIPTELPAVWAMLGSHSRADNLANSVANPFRRNRALLAIARAAHEKGEHRRVDEVLVEAEVRARRGVETDRQLHEIARTAAELGHHRRADRVTGAVTSAEARCAVLVGLAETAAEAGDSDRANALLDDAEELARSITNDDQRRRALTEVGRVAPRLGEASRASALLAEAEGLAETVPELQWRSSALGGLAEAAAETGDGEFAGRLLDRAEDLARRVASPSRRADTLSWVAQSAATAGEYDRAEEISRSITEPHKRDWALGSVVELLAGAGEHRRAESLVHDIADADTRETATAKATVELVGAAARAAEYERATDLAGTITDQERRDDALVLVATSAADAGDHVRARRLAEAVTEARPRSRALTSAARAAARAGDQQRAVALLLDAERLARSVTDPDDQVEALTDLVRAQVAGGGRDHVPALLDRALGLAGTITDTADRAQAFLEIAAAANDAGQRGRAGDLLARAEHVAATLRDGFEKGDLLAEIAKAVAAGGDLERAELIAQAIAGPLQRSDGLIGVAKAVAGTGPADGFLDHAEEAVDGITDPETRAHQLAALARTADACGNDRRAGEFLTLAQDVADTVADRGDQDVTRAWIVQVLAETGDHDGAERVVGTIDGTHLRAAALATIVPAVAAAGHTDRARRLLAAAEDAARATTRTDDLEPALADVARATARLGEHDRAESLAGSIEDPDWRSRALGDVALAAAESANPRAETVARSIGPDTDRARALLSIAPHLAAERQVRVVAEALHTLEWTEAIEDLVRVRPDVVATIVTETDLAWYRRSPAGRLRP